jgi:hypothetical protein
MDAQCISGVLFGRHIHSLYFAMRNVRYSGQFKKSRLMIELLSYDSRNFPAPIGNMLTSASCASGILHGDVALNQPEPLRRPEFVL